MLLLLRLLLVSAFFVGILRGEEPFPKTVRRILFLGDSITYAGHYVDNFEAYLFVRYPDRVFEVINCGLPSETVSGLSEPGHANGKFPRPDLHERLDRVLSKIKPDLVFACYGMNDGLVLPFDQERFDRFRTGMTKLHDKVIASGASIIHLTPFVYEPKSGAKEPDAIDPNTPSKRFEGYNEVLDRYSEWLVEQRASGWKVIDIHTALNEALAAAKQKDPGFHFTKDGVHPGPAGHQVTSTALIRGLVIDDPSAEAALAQTLSDPGFAPELFELISKRGRLLTQAWLTETGHLRPGIPAGLPISDAKAQSVELDVKIRALVPEIRTKCGLQNAPGLLFP